MKTSLASLSRWLALFAVSGATLLHAAADYSTPYAFTNLAGVSSIGSRDGAGATARFYSPQDVVTDATGNAYVTDEGNHTIRKITPTGTVSTFAGTFGEAGSADGTGTAAKFDSPQGLAIDAAGNLYVADTGNQIIRKITPAGLVSTLAGLARISGNTDGTGSAARFNRPRRIALDPNGNLYVTEAGNNDVRKITPAGVVTTFATNLQFPETDDIQARVPVSYGAIAVDPTGNVYVSTYDIYNEHSVLTPSGYWPNYYYIGSVRKLTPDGGNTRLWETSVTLTYDHQVFNAGVSALTFNAAGQLVCSQGYLIVRYAPQTDGSPAFVTLAGDGTIGSADGPAASAKFGFPTALAYDRNGNLLVADAGNNVVRKLSAANEVTTLAGLALDRAAATIDGTAEAARFVAPGSLASDAAGNIYVADRPAHCIRKITPSGVVTTLAGTAGSAGYLDGPGSNALFNEPAAIAAQSDGTLFVADYANRVVRKIAPDGTVSSLANGARFELPISVAVDSAGNVYVANAVEQAIRKVPPAGDVSVFAGDISSAGSVDGTGISARFTWPRGLTRDNNDNLYVIETTGPTGFSRIRKITPSGTVSTVLNRASGYADGDLASAQLNSPASLALDANGNLFVADRLNLCLRRITPQGAVSTLAGLVDAPGDADGVGRAARFYYPTGITLDTSGNIYLTSGTAIRKGSLASGPTITTQPTSQTVNAGANVTFTVTASGTPAPTYQWNFNGAAISGATGASLSLSSVSAANAGDYTVVVSNGAGSVTSNKATLTVNTPTNPPPPTGGGSSGGGGGGGGAPSDWFAACVAGALLLRAWLQRRR